MVADGPPRDINTAIDEALLTMERDLNEAGWDSHLPKLFALCVSEQIADGVYVGCVPLPVIPDIYAFTHQGVGRSLRQYLRWVAGSDDAISIMFAPLVDDVPDAVVLGIGFAAESWALAGRNPNTPAEVARFDQDRAWQRAGRLPEHPDRVEVRNVTTHLDNPTPRTAWLTRHRDGLAPGMDKVELLWDDESRIEGNVIKALRTALALARRIGFESPVWVDEPDPVV